MLLSAGQSLPEILDLSFEQIELCVESVLLVKTRAVEELVRPILAGLGDVDYKPPRVSGAPPPRQSAARRNREGGYDLRPYAGPDKARGEQALRSALSGLGVSVVVT